VSSDDGKLCVVVAASSVVVRAGLRHIVESEGRVSVVGEHAALPETLETCRTLRPAVAIVDTLLPPAGGLEATRRIVAQTNPVAVLLAAPSADGDLAVRALDRGASGLVSFNTREEDVRAAVARVAAGGVFLEPALMQEVALRRVRAEPDSIASLSAREFEIFRLLSAGSSVAEAARALRLSPRSVANYQTQIKRKLGVSTAAELVHVAIRRGIVHVAE
jgi:DNA-binding NarL/FixJ family response regulator